jgi:hypothetical protein
VKLRSGAAIATLVALAEASSVSLATVKRLEAKPGIVSANAPTILALMHALETAGIEFTNGDRPGVKLRSNKV